MYVGVLVFIGLSFIEYLYKISIFLYVFKMYYGFSRPGRHCNPSMRRLIIPICCVKQISDSKNRDKHQSNKTL